PGCARATFSLLMTRPPPRSALFPYTTLFRSQPELGADAIGAGNQHRLVQALRQLEQRAEAAKAGEHARPAGARRSRLDAVNERFARVDVDAGITVGEGRLFGHVGRFFFLWVRHAGRK